MNPKLTWLMCMGLYLAYPLPVYALFRLVAVVSRPRIRSRRSQPDLLDTAPAVVNLLAHRMLAAPQAGAATLLDLAARRYLTMEQPGEDPADTLVRVTVKDPAGLRPFERRVHDRVRASAPVTLRELRRRHASDGPAWAVKLEVEVRDEARSAGLSWDDGTVHAFLFPIIMFGLIPGCFFGWGAVRVLGLDFADQGNTLLTMAVGVLATILGHFLTSLLATLLIATSRRERYARRARRVVRHWDSVRRWLRAHESFADLPPAAVTTWDRYLAYGVALGVAPVAAAALDLSVG